MAVFGFTSAAFARLSSEVVPAACRGRRMAAGGRGMAGWRHGGVAGWRRHARPASVFCVPTLMAGRNKKKTEKTSGRKKKQEE